MLSELVQTFINRGDLTHIALFLWAGSASALVLILQKEAANAHQRFDDFVRELARFNNQIEGDKP
jgi:hypothetical protein